MKEGVARTDGGRISRAQNPAEPPDRVAREARMRLFDVPANDASKGEAATVMGRWSLLGQEGGGISQDQYEALKRFSNDRERYMMSVEAPDSLRSREGGGSGSGDEGWKASAKRAYFSAREAIQRKQNESPGSNLWSVVQFVVIEDLHFPHMIGDLRLVGNSLHRHYQGLDRMAKSA